MNFTTSFRTPDDVRSEWAGQGVPAFASADYDRSLDAICERLGVKPGSTTVPRAAITCYSSVSRSSAGIKTGCPRNVRGCDQGTSCGYCGQGCRLGAKQSTVKTWLADAHGQRARASSSEPGRSACPLRTDRRGESRHAPRMGIEFVSAGPRAVVAACGAVNTPALLKRSGLENPNSIGKHLRLHPVTAAWGVFDEEIVPWEGMLASTYSDQDADMDGDGYGVKYEHVATPPSILDARSRPGAEVATTPS